MSPHRGRRDATATMAYSAAEGKNRARHG